MTRKKKFAALYVAQTAILTALSFVLYLLKFNLPFVFPEFLEMQFSDLPALIGGFTLGPAGGCLIVVLKGLLKMPLTSTALAGEIADIIIGISFVLPASLIYRIRKESPHLGIKNLLAMFVIFVPGDKKKSYADGLVGGKNAGTSLARSKNANINTAIALIAGTVISTLTAALLNRVLLVPFYVELFFHGNFDAIVGMLSKLYNGITRDSFYYYYISFGVLPFNLLRGTISAALTFFVYKRIRKAFF
ncbi:MAG: ECF transporter S component [Clostridiales bacterium]|jgi:riboflavin transporter FmnP|nr:ECF transporter S component [Clostridiales bacterium]